jgi:Zn-dependent protease
MTNLRFAVYLGVSMFIGMTAREFVRAFVTAKLGDPTPRLWGRISLNPKAWFDPFGSGVFPILILVLWASGAPYHPPPFAYAKPAALDPAYLKGGTRDVVIASLAGPVTNLLIAIVAGVLIRPLTFGSEVFSVALAFLMANVTLAVFNLLPIPGLDGARILGRFLPPHPREVFINLDKYLILFILAVFFLLAGPMLAIVQGLGNVVCRGAAGFPCF